LPIERILIAGRLKKKRETENSCKKKERKKDKKKTENSCKKKSLEEI